MRLICAVCGNFVHFEADVELIQIISFSSQGLIVRDQDNEGVFDSAGWLHLGLLELVEYCERQDKDVLRWDAGESCYVNSHIRCARCGSRRVSVPYCNWSPPRQTRLLEEEIFQNHQEFAWLRKERERHGHSLPVLR